MTLEDWLAAHGLEDRVEAFRAERVTLADLPLLTDADLRELGLSLGERRRFRQAIIDGAAQGQGGEGGPRDRMRRLVREERRPLTAMFVDIVNFTMLAEQIPDEELLETARAFRDLCEAAIGRTGGRIAKFLGDGILACFCYPVAHENDPERAVRAALEIAASVGEIRPLPHWPLAARIGIATGSVIVGELFAEGEAFSPTGSVLNLAARLQAAAASGAVVVSEATHERIAASFDTVSMGPRELKGFLAPVRCWRVVGPARGRVADTGRAPVLHGRGAEMAVLEHAWARVQAGATCGVLLRGEAGVGKTALLEEFMRARQAAGDASARIAGSDLDRDTPFFPVAQLLRMGNGEARGPLDGDPVTQALVARLGGFPFDAALLATLSAPRLRERMLDAAADLLLAREAGPLCLVVEDAHWLDPSSTELLARLIERARMTERSGVTERSGPTLLVVTARRAFVPPWAADAPFEEVALERLAEDAVRAMARDLLGPAAPEALVARIVERTDGVPLFVEAVSRQLRQRFDAADPSQAGDASPVGQPQGGTSQGALQAGGAGDDVPSSLREALMARLDRSGVAKAVAQAAAVIGYQVETAVLGAVEELRADELGERLVTLVDRSVLRAQDAAGTGYAFRHALVRDIAYESLLRDTRRHLHGRAADALLALHPEFAAEQPATLALHLTEAGRAAEAAGHWLEAARRALGNSGLTEAVRLLRRGLGAVHELNASPERTRLELELLGLLGPALMALNGPGAVETREHYERSYALCQVLDEAPAHFPIYWGWWRVSSDFHAMRARSGWLLTRARAGGDTGTLMQAHHCNWASCYHVGAFDRCCEHIESGLTLYGDADWQHHAPLYGNHDARACAHGELAMVRWMQGRTGDAFESHRESLSWSRGLGHLGSIMHSMDCALTFHAMRQAHAEAFDTAELMTALAEEHGFADHEAKSRIYRGWALARREDPAGGLGLLQEGFARQKDIGTSEDFPIYVCLHAETLMAAGKPDLAAAELLAARAQFRASGLRVWLPEVLRITAAALDATRSGVPVLPILEEAASVAAEQGVARLGLRVAADRAALLERLGDPEAAATILRDAFAAMPEGEGHTPIEAGARLARLDRVLLGPSG